MFAVDEKPGPNTALRGVPETEILDVPHHPLPPDQVFVQGFMHEGWGAVIHVVDNMGEGWGVWKWKIDYRVVGV